MHFLAMGHYGGFIWPAYAVSALALIAAVVLTLRGYFRVAEQLRQMRSESERPAI
ncbi:MAG TPA: heme exporter protein CcmD [Rhizomicrobium sp.]|nr:heme exporter protein CcmD [Rhizomicrobium sp.]